MSIALVMFAASVSFAAPTTDWVVLRISRVRAKPKKVDGTTWDVPNDKRKGDGCGFIGIAGKAAFGPAGGAIATYLCSHSNGPLRERDPQAPDLFVQLVAGVARYRTPIAYDTYEEAFDYSIVVPIDGVPTTGLELQVLDQDLDVGAGELIGMVRVTKKQLQDAIASGNPLLTLSDSQLDLLEVEVAPYSSTPQTAAVQYDVSKEPVVVSAKARAGELVSISAHGTNSVADKGQPIDENRYVNGDKRGYNRVPDFAAANHATAIAYVGSPTETHSALVVGSCVEAVSPVEGNVVVGVNDHDLSNNKGAIAFTVHTSLPTIEQWRAGGAFACPKPSDAGRVAVGIREPTTKETSLTPDVVLAKIQRAYLAGIRRCYKAHLEKDPAATGKVSLSLTVNETGRTLHGIAAGFPAADVNDCITGQMASWRFPIPHDEHGEPAVASFSITLKLVGD